MKKVSEIDVGGKKLLVRVDLNSTVKNDEVELTPRIKAHSRTIDELSERGARVVILAHQGRPGRDDFLHLRQHSKLLEGLIGRRVNFVESVCGTRALEAIPELGNGEILLLDNVRMHEDELKDVSPKEHGKSELVRKLSGVCDIYVNDAFSVCHRNQASITGFPQVMDSCLGPRLEEELDALEKLDDPPEPVYFILGGDKPGDAVDVMETMFDSGKLDVALLGGVIGETFLQVSGIDLGMKKHGVEEVEGRIERLMENYGDSLVLPVDVAYREEGKRKEVPISNLPVGEEIFDIGSDTIQDFKDKIKNAETIVMNGPLGKFEEEIFAKSTKEIFEALKGLDKFTLVGGGDTSEALEGFGFDLEKDFSHVSLAGGAFTNYLSGKKLPGIEALR